MRLIDADAKMVAQLNDFETESVVEKEMTVNDYLSLSYYDAPTIDAEPIVRCKDCKYYSVQKRSKHWNDKALACTRSARITVNEYDFCSFGERKDND